MPGFQFELSQLVTVPGVDQQGRVCARMEYVGKPSLYQVTWLKADLDPGFEVFSEADLLAAQQKPLSVTVNADTESLRQALAVALEELKASKGWQVRKPSRSKRRAKR